MTVTIVTALEAFIVNTGAIVHILSRLVWFATAIIFTAAVAVYDAFNAGAFIVKLAQLVALQVILAARVNKRALAIAFAVIAAATHFAKGYAGAIIAKAIVAVCIYPAIDHAFYSHCRRGDEPAAQKQRNHQKH
jgi:hypothetical protein